MNVKDEKIYLLVALAIFIAIGIPYIDLAPSFDGSLYVKCILKNVSQPFDLWSFDCFNHPSMLYLFLVSIPQYLSYRNLHLLNGVVLIIGSFSLISFYLLSKKLLPIKSRELLAFTLIYALYPIGWGAFTVFSPDYGCMAISVIYLSTLVYQRQIISLLIGTLLVLTKEQGIMAYTIITSTYFIFYQLDLSKKQALPRFFSSLITHWYQFFPAIVIITYYSIKSFSGRSLFWGNHADSSLLTMFLSFDLASPVTLTQLTDMFVLNFTWLMSFFIICGLLLVIRQLFITKSLSGNKLLNTTIGFSFVSVVMMTYMLTRYKTFTNTRYLVIIYPILLLLFAALLFKFVRTPKVRIVILSVFVSLNFASLYRTSDPVSKMIFGTFSFGGHELLSKTSLTKECCGNGRDQLAYNLEYIQMFRLEEKVYRELGVKHDDVIVIADSDYPPGKWQLWAESHRRSIAVAGVLSPRYLNVTSALTTKPAKFIYLSFPTYDNQHYKQRLSSVYDRETSKIVRLNEYHMEVTKYALKEKNIFSTDPSVLRKK